MLITLAIVLPLVGALGTLGLLLLPRFRPYSRYIALGTVGLTAIIVAASRWLAPAVAIPSLWRPVSLFGATLLLQNDLVVQPLVLGLTLVAGSAALAAIGRTGEPHHRLGATMLALLSAGLLSLWAANPLTMIVGWAIYDLLQAVGCISANSSVKTTLRGFIQGNLATLLLWAGAALAEGGVRSELWTLVTPGRIQLALWAMAGLLRLWLYPFHLAIPDDSDADFPLAIMLLQSPITGWGLWLRLASANGGSIPADAWMITLAAVTLAAGGFLAWSSKTPRSTLPWIGMAAIGATLLTAQLAGADSITIISAGSVTWMLSIATLFLNDGLQQDEPWWSLPPLVGAGALLGIPLTLGFVTQTSLLERLTRSGRIEWGVAFFIGDILLLPTLINLILLPVPALPPERHWSLLMRRIGQALPALLLVGAGLYPQMLIGGVRLPPLGRLFAAPGLAGWLLWAASLAGGGVLTWQESNMRPKISLLLTALHDLLRLDWLYEILLGALDRGWSVLRAADEIVGGAGALLWSWLLFLIILLAWSGK